MKISVITQDQTVVVDGHAQRFDFQVPNGEWAIQFDFNTGLGEVEYIDARPNETITSFDKYQFLFTGWEEGVKRDREAREAAEAAARAEAEAIAEAEAQADTAA